MPRHFLSHAESVRARLDGAGWSATSGWDFDLYWRPQVPSRAAFANLPPGARVNHIPGIGAVTSPRLTGRTSTEGADASSFVLITSVDPLRIFVHGESDEETDRIITGAILDGRDAMTRAVRDLVAERGACFELLRFDFAREETGARRLLRCVLSPPLSDHPHVGDDTLQLVGILRDHPERVNGFRPIVPAPHTNDLLAASPLLRWSDLVLTPSFGPEPRLVLLAARGFAGKRIVLLSPSTQRLRDPRERVPCFYVCNQVAGFVWLCLEDGATLDEIAESLHGQFPISLDQARSDVWDLAARWAHDGLLARAPVPEIETVALDSTEPRTFAIPGIAVARDGGCIVMAGEPSLGGGAIAALLGCPFASGRVLVERESVAALPAPSDAPFGLEISELDERAVAEVLPGFTELPSYVLSSELHARFVPFDPPAPGTAPARVTALVFVRRTATDAPATLTPIDATTALESLVHRGFAMHPAMTPAETEAFFAWINDLSCFTLDTGGDLASAAAHVDALLRRGDFR